MRNENRFSALFQLTSLGSLAFLNDSDLRARWPARCRRGVPVPCGRVRVDGEVNRLGHVLAKCLGWPGTHGARYRPEYCLSGLRGSTDLVLDKLTATTEPNRRSRNVNQLLQKAVHGRLLPFSSPSTNGYFPYLVHILPCVLSAVHHAICRQSHRVPAKTSPDN